MAFHQAHVASAVQAYKFDKTLEEHCNQSMTCARAMQTLMYQNEDLMTVLRLMCILCYTQVSLPTLAATS